MAEEKDRIPVQVGVDYRPLPLQMPKPDLTVWLFDPDPGKAFFAKLEELQNAEETNPSGVLEALEATLIAALVDDRQKREFAKKEYGINSLRLLSETYSEQAVGLPTQPSSASGRQRNAGGGKR